MTSKIKYGGTTFCTLTTSTNADWVHYCEIAFVSIAVQQSSSEELVSGVTPVIDTNEAQGTVNGALEKDLVITLQNETANNSALHTFWAEILRRD